MENYVCHLETLFSGLDSFINASFLREHFGPLLWRKHFLQEDRGEFSAFLKHKENSLAVGNSTEKDLNIAKALSLLQKASESWPIPVQEIANEGNKISLKLSRVSAFRVVLSSIIKGQGSYGDSPKLNLNVEVPRTEKDLSGDLTKYRMHLFEGILVNALHCAGYVTNGTDMERQTVAKLKFTSKSQKSTEKGLFNVYFGKVVGESGETLSISSAEYLKLRELDIREMSAHKYWERSRDSDIMKLAEAAVAVDLIQAKPSNPVKIRTEETSLGMRQDCSKGAVFILYNYARLVSIKKKFEDLVSRGLYPPLPVIDDVDISLLTHQDEWLILFNFLLEYPSAIRRAVDKVENGDVGPHSICIFTSKLCHAFSVYYRRVRILLESRPHLNATVFARLSLVSAIEMVLTHAMGILNLPMIDHM